MKKGEDQKHLRYPSLDFKRKTAERNAEQKQNGSNIAITTTTMTAVTITKSTTAQKKNKHASKQTKQTKNYRTKYVT